MTQDSADLYILRFKFINCNDDYKETRTAFLLHGTEKEIAQTYASYAARELGMTVRGYITDLFSGAWDDPAADHYYREATDDEIETFIFDLKTSTFSEEDETGYELFNYEKWRKYNIPLQPYNEDITFKYD